MNNNELLLQIKNLPEKTGIYQFFDKNKKLIYIGKAKNLKKRILQYFQKEVKNKKTQLMVSKIFSLKTIILESEFDALFLENNLIKELKPKYNILLKDDKSFPWILITKESFPRILYTRKKNDHKGEYFGPYLHTKHLKFFFELIHSLYPIRSCNLDLNTKKIKEKKFKVCLEYHIKNCNGPCENFQSEKEYLLQIQDIKELIKGNFTQIINNFEKKMIEFSNKLNFEKAQEIKEKIIILKNYQTKSLVIHPKFNDLEVFSIISNEISSFINYIKVNNGAIVQSFTQEYKKILNESNEEILIQAILNIRRTLNSNTKEVITNIKLSYKLKGIKITNPKIGDKKKILNLSLKNAKYYRIQCLNRILSCNQNNLKKIMQEMKNLLHLSSEPRYIECFDNSNLQGSFPTSSCIVFRNGKPSKNEYRIFRIKNIKGPNDFASIEQIILRRTHRLIKEKKELPELIIVDGGKGQVSSAYKILCKLNLQNKISLIGIEKQSEKIYFPNNSIPLSLDKSSETLKIVQYARNEAHRFAIFHHRNQREKNFLYLEMNKKL